MLGTSSECVIRHFIIAPSEIHFLRFLLEAYEGIGMVTTIQAELGLVRLSIAPGCEDDVHHILEHEKDRLRLRPVFSESFLDQVQDP